MDEVRLPGKFLEKMKCLLGEEYDAFVSSYQEGRKNALRVNLLKMTPEQFEIRAPFPVKRVPWTSNGYYVDYQDAPGRHPWYRAGLYYLQEPSAMAPAQILPAAPGDKILDLCAAPGGKATELGARLQGRGILVANEISSSRVRALVHNIELFGIVNAVVTNETPARLADRFEGYFDRVLVDAPCSGEGMFRKDIEAVKAWYPEKVSECAKIQREIILQAADMLRADGYMVYSTCTFEPEENELVIAHLLRERPEMELEKIPCEGGMTAFSSAFSIGELAEKGIEVPEDDLPANGADLTHAVRIWPHLAGGEGHFIALLHKKDRRERKDSRYESTQYESSRYEDSRYKDSRYKDSRYEGSRYEGSQYESNRHEDGISTTGKRRKLKGRISAAGGRSEFAKGRKLKGRMSAGGGNPEQDLALARDFLKTYAGNSDMEMCRYEVRDSHVYLMPENCPDVRGLGFLRAGLHVGELKKNRFEPSQELALALGPADCEKNFAFEKGGGIVESAPGGSQQDISDRAPAMSEAGNGRSGRESTPGGLQQDTFDREPAGDEAGNGRSGRESAPGGLQDDGIHVSIPIGDERLSAYFRGEQIRFEEQEESGKNGWRLVLADRYPAGWGKLTGKVLKNHLPAGWRSDT